MVKLETQVTRLKAKNKELTKKSVMYQKGFYILMCYWDSIYDDEKEKVSKELTRIGL
jgi:hypothetical protein